MGVERQGPRRPFPSQACVGRAVATGRIQDPDLAWVDDATPVYCSNVAYDADGVPARARYPTERKYVDRVDDGWGIDPAFYVDGAGRAYLTWGSGVLHAAAVDAATGGLVADARLADGSGPGKDDFDDAAYRVVSRGADEFNEAPYVYARVHDGTRYYYLWVNWFACCAGSCSTYLRRSL